jgi:CHASE3 domain sensor protein
MKIRSKIILAFLVTLLPVILIGVLSIIQLRKISNPIINDIPQNMAQLSVTSELEGYASFIRYYDEILTQSARNYAFTGDDYWKNRYYEVAPKLDEMINLAIDKGDQEDKESFSSINSANLALIALEEESISLVSR